MCVCFLECRTCGCILDISIAHTAMQMQNLEAVCHRRLSLAEASHVTATASPKHVAGGSPGPRRRRACDHDRGRPAARRCARGCARRRQHRRKHRGNRRFGSRGAASTEGGAYRGAGASFAPASAPTERNASQRVAFGSCACSRQVGMARMSRHTGAGWIPTMHARFQRSFSVAVQLERIGGTESGARCQ